QWAREGIQKIYRQAFRLPTTGGILLLRGRTVDAIDTNHVEDLLAPPAVGYGFIPGLFRVEHSSLH
ncbi:MAG: hypothetical protein ACREF9_14140, partial [Opitutaceae bacterium]